MTGLAHGQLKVDSSQQGQLHSVVVAEALAVVHLVAVLKYLFVRAATTCDVEAGLQVEYLGQYALALGKGVVDVATHVEAHDGRLGCEVVADGGYAQRTAHAVVAKLRTGITAHKTH